MECILSNRKFKVFLNDKASKYIYLQNEWSQGSVLSPVLFNVYTSNITETTARKLMNADDIALVAQANTLETVETTLNQNLNKLHNYFKRWYLTLNLNKTVAMAFH